jgi:hypothetical protein
LWGIFSSLSNPLIKIVQKLSNFGNKSKNPDQQNQANPSPSFFVKSWEKLTKFVTKLTGTSQP